jgi:hypothetical protein
MARHGPSHFVLVDQQSHQLGNRERRVRVVQLDGERRRAALELPALGHVLREHVLQRGAHEEVLLLEAQLLALRRGVVRVEHAREFFASTCSAEASA